MGEVDRNKKMVITLENSMVVSYKLNIHIPYYPEIPLLQYLHQSNEICPPKDLYVV